MIPSTAAGFAFIVLCINLTAEASGNNTTVDRPTSHLFFVPKTRTNLRDTSTDNTDTTTGRPKVAFRLPAPQNGCGSERDHTKIGALTLPNGSSGVVSSDLSVRHGNLSVCEFESDVLWMKGKFCVYPPADSLDCPKHMTLKNISLIKGSRSIYDLRVCCVPQRDQDAIVEPQWGNEPFVLIPYGDKCEQVTNVIHSDRELSKAVAKVGEKVKMALCRYSREVTLPGRENLDGNIAEIIFGLSAICGVLFLIIILLCVCRRRKKPAKVQRHIVENIPQEHIATTEITLEKRDKSELTIGSLLKMILNAESQMTIYGLLIRPSKLETLDKIGKGAFGTVFKGRYTPDNNPLHIQEVAIKTLKENCVYPEISAFMEEAMVMAHFCHVNVLGIIGVCIDPDTEIPSLVLPFMKHGDLQKYLRQFRYDDEKKNKTPEPTQLLSFCLHIARGMTCLSDIKFVHRDLAARNCMLDSNMVVKVADFGLTRDIYSNSYYRQDKNKLLPIKWMALESLQDRVFSTYTDVWSYGVTIWEIFTLGKVPYPNLENIQVLPELEKGERLPKPETCPDSLYDLMLKCWDNDSKARPSFTDISKVIEEILSGLCEYLDLDLDQGDKSLNISAGVVCTPRHLAESQFEPAQIPYADYRDLCVKAKGKCLNSPKHP